MLTQDTNTATVNALLAISQNLATIAAVPGNTSTSSFASTALAPDLVPPHHAVIINTLWYFSLSLSVATSLLSMLAKDWCYSFGANRTGHSWDQALRRQRKWTMIEQWKMQELINVLPFFIHSSLCKHSSTSLEQSDLLSALISSVIRHWIVYLCLGSQPDGRDSCYLRYFHCFRILHLVEYYGEYCEAIPVHYHSFQGHAVRIHAFQV
jgi:hypothetical protein